MKQRNRIIAIAFAVFAFAAAGTALADSSYNNWNSWNANDGGYASHDTYGGVHNTGFASGAASLADWLPIAPGQQAYAGRITADIYARSSPTNPSSQAQLLVCLTGSTNYCFTVQGYAQRYRLS
jgi:hypothetical protein